MDENPRASKRARQACRPCRRKKSKCSGEQPVYSTCARLRHTCIYGQEQQQQNHAQADGIPASLPSPIVPGRERERDQDRRPTSSWEDRIERMEDTLSQVVQALNKTQQNQNDLHSHSATSRHDVTDTTTADSIMLPTPKATTSPRASTLPSEQSLEIIGHVYLRYCECQPLPLFDHSTFVSSLITRDPELIYAVTAAVRWACPNDCALDEKADYVELAHDLAMARVTKGSVELSTIQTLCLLSFSYLNDGQFARSRLLCSMAASLARSAQLSLRPTSTALHRTLEERIRCFWATVLLCRFLGEPEPLVPSTLSSDLLLPTSPATPSEDIMKTPTETENQPSRTSFGILEVVIQLSEIWPMISKYVRTRGGSVNKEAFPWDPTSQYATTLGVLMNLGFKLPLIYRYRSMNVSSISSEHLEKSRNYWAPWFLTRLVYHTIICILNHPLLLTLQIRHIQNVSEAFLQQTSWSLTNHISWIMHFLDFFMSREFVPSDPWLVYWVAVVITIELQRSHSNNTSSIQSKENVAKCFKFIHSLEYQSVYIRQMISRLRRLETRMAVWSSSADVPNDQHCYVDISGILEILEGANQEDAPSGEGSASTIFGSTLSSQISREDTSNEAPTQLPIIKPVERDGT
ncbi:C6 transcription factor, partial [Fusarium globosum]